MINVIRLSKPVKLQQNGHSWTQELCTKRKAYYQELEKYEQKERPTKPDFPKAKNARYAHKDIKQTLKRMFGAKCAYCESQVTAVSYQHVEHFRPQSIYPRLAYDWDNLLLACEVCNSGYKAARFPLSDGRQPAPDEKEPCLLDDSDENALINPCFDDPEEFFDFSEDGRIICRNKRAEYTRDVCGLDREALNDARELWAEIIENMAKAFLAANEAGRIEEKNRYANTLKKCFATQYSALVRAKLKTLTIDETMFNIEI